MADTRTGCVLLRELPPRPTQRSCKISTELEQTSAVLDLKAFCGAEDEQQQQLQAFEETWGMINHTLEELRQHHLAPVFSQLQQWVADSAPALQDHPGGQPLGLHTSSPLIAGPNRTTAVQSDAAAAGGATLRQLPLVALSVASSTNTSDTYAQLKLHLRGKGHAVALITAREAASGLPAVISSTMRQYMPNVPEAKSADDIPALLAWWQDEWQRAYGSCAHTSRTCTAPATAATAQTPKTASKACSRAVEGVTDVDDVDAAAVAPMKTPGRAAGAAATPGRALRARPAAKTPGKPGASTGAALAVPVVVLQDADTGDLETLEELVVAFSEARTAGLPVVLVLGVSSSPACLLQLLPNALLRRVRMFSLALPPARQQLVHMYRALLLRGPQPHLLLGPQLASWLLQHFRDADCSASMAERVMQFACVEHFRGQPLSCLAAAAASGSRSKLAAAVAALPQPQVVHCCQALLSHPAATAAVSSSGIAVSPNRSPAAKLNPAASAAANGSEECNAAAALQQLRLFVDANSSSSNKTPSKQKAAAAAGADSAAAAALESAVWAAMQAFGRWRLGVLMLNALAQFTGVADVDASFQLPSLFAAASQANFLTSKTRGSLSPCGLLLLKLLGNSSSSARRAGVITVQELQDDDCIQLLQNMQQLVASSAGQQQEQAGHKHRNVQQRQPGLHRSVAAAAASAAAAAVKDNDTDTDSDTSIDDEAAPDPATDSALASCLEVQQLQHALQALQQLAAKGLQDSAAAEPSTGEMLQSPQKKQKRHHKKQQQHSQDELLAEFAKNFAPLLTSLPEQLEQPAAAARDALLPSAAAGGGTPASVCTPVGKAARKSSSNTGSDIPTPGGLASALRKHVRFAPDTPGAPVAANGKHAGSLSAHSTPDDVAAVAGHIKTPSKRGAKKEQPRKALFTQAAAAAAAAAAEGGKSRRMRKVEKKPEEEGEIAGTSAAALAAVAAAAAGGAAGSPQVPAAAGNKRAQRLMQLLAASNGGSSAGSSRSASGSSTPAPAAGGTGCRSSTSSKGLLSTPTHAEDSDAATVASSPEGALLSPRSSRGSTRQRSTTAAAAAAVTPPTAAASGRGPTRSSSRLSRQSEPQHDIIAAADDQDDALVDATETVNLQNHQQQQQQLANAGNVTATANAPRAACCSSTLAALLSAIIPKLLHDWCSNGSSSSNIAPLAAAGSAAFLFDDVELVSNMLCAAPRCTVHAALTEPAKLMPGHPVLQGPGWDDTCLAYLLLQQQREDSMAVSDWFGMFCQAQGVKGLAQGTVEDAEEGLDAVPGVGRAAKARARAGRKARGYAEARDSACGASAAGAAATRTGKDSSSNKGGANSSSKDQTLTPKGSAKKRSAAAAATRRGASDQQQQEEGSEVDEQELLAAAARFCQSVAELQHLGVWKATKRRRLAAVQRVFAPEGPGMVLRYSGSAAAAAAAAMDSLPDHDYE